MRTYNRLTTLLPPLGVIAALIAAWIGAVRVFDLPGFILPAPAEVLGAAWATRARLVPAILETTAAALVGLGAALGISIVTALGMDMYPLFRRACYPLIFLSQTVQILAVAPLIIIWFGFGRPSTLLITILFCFFPITVALVQGLANTPRAYVAQLRVLHASRWQIWRYARFPAALPALFSGIRVAAAYALIAATIGEWVGGSSGIGVYLLRAKNALRTDEVFAGMLTCSVVSIILFAIVVGIERRALPWHYRHGRQLFYGQQKG